jgi:D-alanyl-D-alanine endopeptidase (penicillin-binding protein 7)
MTKFFIALLFLPLSVFASNSVVYNITSNQVISGSLESKEVSIASISKLMTIYTVLKQNQDLTEVLPVDSTRTPTTKLAKGMSLTRLELINLALISSDNKAAITLSQHFPGGQPYFIYSMNEHARDLGMNHTGFVEPTGLSPMNFSSVEDIVKLTQAVSQFDIVKQAAQAHGTKASPKKGKKNLRVSSNPTSSYFGKDGIITIKTGFTKAAGFCITMLVMSNNQLYNITVLGAKSKQERQKIVERSLSVIRQS